jgi:sugar lactone lactonase YvrE
MFTPVSVEWDARDKTLWVADQYLPRVAHVEEDGAPISTFGAAAYSGGRIAGLALEPTGTGHLFISDPDFQRIVRVDPTGSPAGSFSTAGLGITDPADLAWDSRDGSLYVADPTQRAIFHLHLIDADANGAPDGATLLDSFSTIALGSDNPMGLALDPSSGHLFISDPSLDRVFELSASGSLITSFDTGAYGGGSVIGLSWESPGSKLRLADAGRKLLTFSSSGALLGKRETAPFGTLSPQGIAWDASNSALVTVSGERKMIRFEPEPPDGTGSVGGITLHRQEWTSSFGSIAPVGIVLDSPGVDRYVLDGFQDRVFRVSPQGVVISSFDTGLGGSSSPTGITLGPGGGAFYLTDNVARKVFQLSSTGTQIGSFSTSPFKHKPQAEPLCNDPVGITYDGTRDHFFVADGSTARITEITRTGDFVASFSTAPSASSPTDLALDAAGDRLVVSDSSGMLVEFSRAGTLLVKYPPVPLHVRLAGAAGVWVEPSTLHRVVHDPAQNAAIFLSRSGAALSQISLQPYGLLSPSGAAWLASASKLYVVDQALKRLYAITAGPDGYFGNADDTSTWISTASFGSAAPKGIALNQDLGKVGWVDESTVRLYWANLALGYLGSIDLTPSGATAPRGVDQDPTSANVFSSDPVAGLLISGPGGNPIQATSWGSLGVADPGGVGLSPVEALLLVVDRAAHTLVSVDLSAFFLPEVTGLEFLDDSQMTWSTLAVFASYQLFRGDISLLPTGAYGGCDWVGPNPPMAETETPLMDSGWFYLVAGKNMTGLGSLGTRSDGVQRPPEALSPACP